MAKRPHKSSPRPRIAPAVARAPLLEDVLALDGRSDAAPPAKFAYFNRELSWLAFNRRVL